MEESVKQFCHITGAEKHVGEYYIDACNGDLDAAIGMHMDTGGVHLTDTNLIAPSDTASVSANDKEENTVSVRAPIPQKTEVLIEDNVVNFARQRRPRKPQSVFDCFRDFQAEAKQQQMAAAGNGQSKRKTLEDIFRPPIELLHKGTFRSACEHGCVSKKWLMVNLQNVQEFACQVLNRDVWSQSVVKDVIKEHFVFWQIYSDSQEGQAYMRYYPVSEWPYVAVLDPRTGEKLIEWNKLDAGSFCELVSEFLAVHSSLNDSTESESPRKKIRRDDSILDDSEEKQLAIALKASLEDQSSSCLSKTNTSDTSSNSDTSDLETFSDSASDMTADNKDQSCSSSKKSAQQYTVQSCCPSTVIATDSNGVKYDDNGMKDSTSSSQDCDHAALLASDDDTSTHSCLGPLSADNSRSSWRCYLGPESDPTTDILLRLPDGLKKHLKMPTSSTLRSLFLYAEQNGFPLDRYELVTNFPKRHLSCLDADLTLADSKLCPQETVFIQERSS